MEKDIEVIGLVDMDDSICEYSLQLEADVKELFGDELSKLSENARREVGRLIRCQYGWYTKLKPIKLGLDIVGIMQKIGYKLMILTKGNIGIINAWNEKVLWCKANIPGALITITEDKGYSYGRVLLDDYPGYINRWLEWRPRGLVVMPDRHGAHGNQGFTHPQVIRVKGEEDFKMLEERLQEAYDR